MYLAVSRNRVGSVGKSRSMRNIFGGLPLEVLPHLEHPALSGSFGGRKQDAREALKG